MSQKWFQIIGLALVVLFFAFLIVSLALMNRQDRIDFSDDRLSFVDPAKRPKPRT